MIPPTHIATPPGDVPTGNTPAHAGRDNFRASIIPAEPPFRGVGATSRLLSQPFIVDDLSGDEGPIFVATPLKFLRFDRDSGCCVDSPVHSKPNATKGRHDNV